MAGQTLIPAGDFRTSYAVDTTVFPTTTSRNMMILGIVLICFAPYVLKEYALSLLIQIGIFGIAALGLNIVVGFTGQISIGHAAFFGFGAFTSAYLSNHHIPVFFCIPLAGVVAQGAAVAESRLVGLNDSLKDLPSLTVTEAEAARVRHGGLVEVPSQLTGLHRVLEPSGVLLAVAEAARGRLVYRRVLLPE